MVKNTTIGVLALQGDFLEHSIALTNLGITAKEVRLPEDLNTIDGIIIPGGESTTIAQLIDVFELKTHLRALVKRGLPVWGTCAGMILLAKKLVQTTPVPLGLMDIVVDRNAFGRQINSFTLPLVVSQIGDTPIKATFIRAPKITRVGDEVTVLARLSDNTIVAARERNMLVTSFHPELNEDIRLHKYFLSMVTFWKRTMR